MNIIGHRKIFFFISGSLIVLSVAAVAFYGFRPGIDLTGGTLWQFRIKNAAVSENDIRSFFAGENVEATINKEVGGEGFIMRASMIEEKNHQKYLADLKNKFGSVEELRFESIGPAIGQELRSRAIWAIILVIAGISLYVAFAFRKTSRPVSSWGYGLITVLTLFHDVIIPTGLISLLGKTLFVEMDTNFIVALLVIMGFSVHDTIVVFDRIRENLRKSFEKRAVKDTVDSPKGFGQIVNASINETLPRSINTSLTLVLVLISLFVWGPQILKYFVLVILIGTIVGTYSSIFIASPLLVFWQERKAKKS